MYKIRLSRGLSYVVMVIFLLLSPIRCLLFNGVNTFAFAQQKEQKQVQKVEPQIKGYTYNLKRLLEEIEENLKKVDEEIKQAEIRKRNEEREAKIREHFERGNTFYKEGKLKEAKKEWQKALEISKDPEMRGYIKEAVKRAREAELARKKEERERKRRLEAERKERQHRLNEQAKVFYKQALSLYKSKNYEQAKAKFEQAARVIPGYAKTDYYLSRIPKDIQKEKERLERERQKQIEAKQRERERKLKEEINALYKEAISLYNQDKLGEAKAIFNQILSLDPNHQRARDYLKTKIPNRIKKLQEARQKEQERKLREEREASEKRLREERKHLEAERKKKIANHYKKALIFYRDGAYDLAIQEFNKVLELNPQHKSSQDYLNKKIPARIEAEEKAQRKEKIQSLNKEGKNLYRNKNYDEAIAKFKEVLNLDPENKTALGYLKLIPKRIEEEKERLIREKQRKLKAKQREEERLERRKQKELKRQKREEERKQKEKSEKSEQDGPEKNEEK